MAVGNGLPLCVTRNSLELVVFLSSVVLLHKLSMLQSLISRSVSFGDCCSADSQFVSYLRFNYKMAFVGIDQEVPQG